MLFTHLYAPARNKPAGLVFALVAALVLTGCFSQDKDVDNNSRSAGDTSITFVAKANGSPTEMSSKIDFEFSADISALGLTADDIIIGAMPGVAESNGELSPTDDTGRNWTLPIVVMGRGAAAVAINKTGIDRWMQSVSLYPFTVVDPTAEDLSIKFGVTSAGTTTEKHVNNTFKVIHAYLASVPAVDQASLTAEIIATAHRPGVKTMPAGLATKLGVIKLGDYIDLTSLSVEGYTANGAASDGQGDGELVDLQDKDLLRLMVVGVNTFNEGQGGDYTGNGNGTRPHLVFQFKNMPSARRVNPTNDNTGGYAVTEMREYLFDANADGVGGNFTKGLVAAGVPMDTNIVWGPKRCVSNGGGGSGTPVGADGYATAADVLEDKLWLPTEWEMLGMNYSSSMTYETKENQARLAYYKDAPSRVKSGHTDDFVLASPASLAANSFVYMIKSGAPFGGAYNASTVFGCIPTFCVQ
jgi:hypothetical protein